MNCDGAIDDLDVPIFVKALVAPTGVFFCNFNHADRNGDGRVDGRDVERFLQMLL